MPSKKPISKPKEPKLTGVELRTWRKRHVLTQQEAAEWLGASPRTYENWENDHRSPFHPIAIRARMKARDDRISRTGPRKKILQPKIKQS